MSIYLGNLSVAEIERRTGIEFPQALKDFMEPARQHEATGIAAGKWHCFDMPFMLLCGDMNTAQTIYDHIKHRSSEFKEPLQIGVQ